MANVDLEIKVNSAGAVTAIKNFGKTATSAFDNVNRTLSATKTLFAGVVAFAIGKKIVGSFDEIISSGSEADDTINRLNQSLYLAGDYSAAASQDMQNFAESMQDTTKYSDDLVLSQISVAKTFGATNEQAKKVVAAAADVAAATGKSIEDVTKVISKSLSGDTAGMKEMLKIAPEIKELTRLQLENGQAADILQKRFSGAAASEVNTYSGALAQLTNAQGNLNDSLGQIITQNPAVIALFKTVTDMYKIMTSAVENNKKSISDLITGGISNMIDMLPNLVTAIKLLVESYYALKASILENIRIVLSFYKAYLGLKPINAILNSFVDTADVLKLRFLQVSVLALKFLNLFSGEETATGGKNLRELQKQLEETQNKTSDTLKKQEDYFKDLTDSIGGLSEEFANGRDEAVADFDKIDEKLIKLKQSVVEFGDLYKKNLAEANKGTSIQEAVKVDKTFFDKLKDAWSTFVSFAKNEFDKVLDFKTIGDGLAAILTNGKKAAENLSAKILGGLGEGLGQAFGVSGLGGLIEPLAAAAAQGPEAAKAQAKAFGEAMAIAIPNMVTGLIEALPEIIDALVDSLITRGGIIRIIDAIIIAIPRIVVALGNALVQAFLVSMAAITEMLRIGFTKVFESISWEKLFQGIKDAIMLSGKPQWIADLQATLGGNPPWVKSLIEALNKLAPSGGTNITGGTKSGKTLEERYNEAPEGSLMKEALGGALENQRKSRARGYALGGIVPPGYPNDSYPAMLTSGERIIPAGKTDINSDTAGLLAQIIDLLSRPMQVTTTAEVDRRAFADIMLSLSRTAARTGV